MTAVHWFPPDVRRDILSEAWRPGVADPVAIHVRPEVLARMAAAAADPVSPDAVPLVVDDRLPVSPGYEIHRAGPGEEDAEPQAAPRRP